MGGSSEKLPHVEQNWNLHADVPFFDLEYIIYYVRKYTN